MQYLDYEKLEAIDAQAFAQIQPYPFINPAGLLTEEAYRLLLENLPAVEVMTPSFDRQRSHGQVAHNRYSLEHTPQLQGVSPAWHEFISELHGPKYSRFIQQMYDRQSFRLNMHWHYAPAGCSVSPHCDAHHKLGSHIFYMNSAEEWNPQWGGQTLVLDDGGKFNTNSAPDFEDFDNIIASECMGNYSTLFARRKQSWHGVRSLSCPQGHMRKVFIVVVNHPLLYAGRRALRWLKAKK